MKKLNYKLIVSDFDGTLANSKNEVPEKVINAINGYVAAGGIFAVCTGRILPCILPRLRQMGLKGLAVASQGCQIAEIETGKLIKESRLTCAQASKICTYLEEMDRNVQLYYTYGFLTNLPEGEEHLALYERIVGLKAEHPQEKLSAYALKEDRGYCKISLMVAEEEQRELYEKLLKRFGDDFDVTCSAKVLIEVSPKGETKGNAIKYLANYYGVPMESTVAAGDNLNDVSMIEAAGVGVAVGNAEQALKDKADYVSPTNDECAIADIIERFGYSYD